MEAVVVTDMGNEEMTNENNFKSWFNNHDCKMDDEYIDKPYKNLNKTLQLLKIRIHNLIFLYLKRKLNIIVLFRYIFDKNNR